MTPPRKIRTIIAEERVTETLMRLGVAALRVDDVLGGLTDTICVRPEVFAREPETGWSRIILKEFPPDIPR